MHPRTRELLTYLQEQRTVLREAFDEVPPQLRERALARGRWSAANVIEHLAIVETRIAGRLSNAIADARDAGVAAESTADAVLPSLNVRRVLDRTTRVNAPDAVQPTGFTADEAWAALESATGKVRDALHAGDGLALGTLTLPHPVFGPQSLYDWFGFIGAHEARHASQIREIVSELR